MERVKAQEIVDSDHLWGQLNADEKFSVLRVSMGLPPSVDSSIHTAEEIEQWQQSSEVRFDKVIQRLSQPLMGQPDDQVKDRTLFVRIHLEEYLISWEVLDQVFSSVGNLEIIEIFDNDTQFHSRIRFQNRDSAFKAFNYYNGKCFYDGCCKLELILEKDLLRSQSEDQRPTFSKESSDEICLVGDEDLPRCESVDEIRIQVQESVPSMVVQVGKEFVLDAYNLFDEMPMGDNSEKLQENRNLDLNKEFASLNIPLRSFDSDMQEIQSNNDTEVFDDLEIDGDSSKVISDHVEAIAYDVSYGEKDVIAGELSDSNKIRLCYFNGKIFEFGGISTVHHVFAEMPNRGFNGIDYSTQLSNAHLPLKAKSSTN